MATWSRHSSNSSCRWMFLLVQHHVGHRSAGPLVLPFQVAAKRPACAPILTALPAAVILTQLAFQQYYIAASSCVLIELSFNGHSHNAHGIEYFRLCFDSHGVVPQQVIADDADDSLRCSNFMHHAHTWQQHQCYFLKPAANATLPLK